MKESVFKGKNYISRSDFRQWIRKRDLYNISRMSESERLQFEEGLSKTYRSYLEKGEIRRIIKDLEMEKAKTKDRTEQMKLDGKINLMKKLSES